MYQPPRYLEWARRYYGKVPFDLASSGLAAANADVVGWPSPWDAPEPPARLRAAIATFNGVPEREVVPALGATHALWLAFASLVTPGDDVLVESPGYEPIWNLAEAAGARVVRFERDAESGYALDIDAVLAAFTPQTRVVALSDPHNPSGARADDGALFRLAEAVAARGARLLVDEVYAPLGRMNPGALVWGRSARKLHDGVVAVSSLTKSFGLGDARIGWVLAPPEVIERAEGILLATTGHLPALHASFGAHAFTRVADLAARAEALTQGKREVVEAWLTRRDDLRWSAPCGGLFGFAVRRGERDLLPFIEAGAERHGVLVAAGAFFGVPNGFRLSWTIDRARLPEALERLGRALPG
jgi:aspartate/methionine/tyrosine aminotransferase